MKKVIAMILAMVMVLTAATAMADTIKIGVFQPFSGDNGAGGRQEALGIEYAHSLTPSVTVGGTTYDIELVVVDNQTDSSKAVSAAQSLVSAGVKAVVGSYGSGVCMAAGDVFAEAGIPAVAVSATNPSVTALCDYYWRICFLDPFQGTVMANFAKDIGVTKAYALSMLGEDYGFGLCNNFADAFTALGFEVVSETFPEGNSDFTAYINNALAAGCDAIFCPSSTPYASLIVDQAAAQGVTIPILAGDTWDSSVTLQAAQGKDVKVYISSFFDEGDASAAAAAFINGFKAWMNEDGARLTDNGGNDIVAAVSALGFDGYNTVIAAIQAADSVDSEAIAQALPSLTYTGVTGSIAFDETGDAIKDTAYIKQVKTDELAFQFVKIQTVADNK